jgi:hypothetical protein
MVKRCAQLTAQEALLSPPRIKTISLQSKLASSAPAHVSGRIAGEVRGTNRFVYDISSKPPATIEST